MWVMLLALYPSHPTSNLLQIIASLQQFRATTKSKYYHYNQLSKTNSHRLVLSSDPYSLAHYKTNKCSKDWFWVIIKWVVCRRVWRRWQVRGLSWSMRWSIWERRRRSWGRDWRWCLLNIVSTGYACSSRDRNYRSVSSNSHPPQPNNKPPCK